MKSDQPSRHRRRLAGATADRRLHLEILARRKGARRRDKRAASTRIMAQWASTIAAAAAHRLRPASDQHNDLRASVDRRSPAGIQLAVSPQPLWLRNHNSGPAQRIMVKRLETSPHDPLGITDSACKNQLVVVSVQYGPFNPYIPIRSTTIGKSRVAIDPIAMHTSWRSNSDIASVTRVSMTFRVVRTNQYNQDLGLIHSTNSNHLDSPNEGSSIDHQVTIYLHAQNITMLPTNETWYFASQILVSNSGGLILILTAQLTRNMFRIHSDY
ncbi:triacylglycerol lipase [Dorcoceras hygrometricum]|uniref:Triacylglycerol lipase n=1 Tax=Dorcoceras hygrometricum TaxID=472368 RepID=A0A2Z7BAF8_9LAMI|nr:triacylglycerol lipase [Dorcoceras hygrometricum]